MHGGFLVPRIAEIRLPRIDSIQSIPIGPTDIENCRQGTPFPDAHLDYDSRSDRADQRAVNLRFDFGKPPAQVGFVDIRSSQGDTIPL